MTHHYHPEIGRMIEERINARGGIEAVAPLAHRKLRHTPNSAYSYLRYLTRGFTYGTLSVKGAERNGGYQLARLAVILHLLKVQENDEIIDKIRAVDDRFKYP